MNFPEEIRARVRNMAVYFVENTIKVDKRKLNKLFYLSDVAAYKKTAFTLSEQDYVAQKFGPVPVAPVSRRPIWDEFSLGDLISRDDDDMCSPKDGVSFDDGEFTDRELTILREICQAYYSMTGDELSDVTHRVEFPWHAVWHSDQDTGKNIPFDWFEKDMSQEEKDLRRVWRDDAKRNFEAFSHLRERIQEAQAK